MSVESSYAKEPVRTYKDDIIYQTVKDSHKRTPFVSCDHQIVNMGANTIRNIEKSERLVTSDLRRSQTALLDNLERLQKVQDSISSGHGSDRRLSQRRLSAPFVSFHRYPSPNRKITKRGSEGSEGDIDGVETPQGLSNIPSPRRERTILIIPNGEASPGAASPNMKEVRRLSFVAQEETSKEALKKVNAMVAEHKRRATISVGSTHTFGLLPNASDLARLREIAKRSKSIEEEHYPSTEKSKTDKKDYI